jgi:hypothetical protein
MVDGHGPRKVCEEDERAFEDGDKDEVAAGVVLRDLGPELLDTVEDLLLGEVDLTEPRGWN